MANMLQAFPEKTGKERALIAKKFYHNLTDTFVETIKTFSVSKEFLNRRCSGNFEVIHRLEAKGNSFQIHPAHHFNWEWANLHYSINFRLPFLAVYMPMSNKAFEKIFCKNRSKFGSIMLPATDMRSSFMPWRSKPHILGLVADQNPGHPGNAFWLHFFNKVTPFVKGPEKSAREKKCAVVFTFIKKVKRGYYHTEFILATEDASEFAPGELTKLYVQSLSERMKTQPADWLWSHRRWKWDWKPEYGEVIK